MIIKKWETWCGAKCELIKHKEVASIEKEMATEPLLPSLLAIPVI